MGGQIEVTLRLRIYPQPGWPGILEARNTYTVTADGLTVDVTATNLGAIPVPYGYGAHPYLTVGENVVDDITLTVPAASYLVVDGGLLPTELLRRGNGVRLAHRPPHCRRLA